MLLLVYLMGLDSEKVKKALGTEVRSIREELGLTQSQLADLSGLHRTYVAGVENGGRNLTIESLIKLATSLKALPSELLRRANA